MNAPLTLFLVAGEPSGDALGAGLMRALSLRLGEGVRFAGVGGEQMTALGFDSLFPMSDLSVMGLTEVVPRIPLLLRRIKETAAAAREMGPAAVVTIDAPDFSFRVGRRLKGLGFPLIHYVAPSVWAWRPGRAGKIAAFLDHLLALLPFEPPYFEAVGLPCGFVGHSIVESGADRGDGAAFRARHGLGADTSLLCVLPGSRRGEVAKLLPVFGETVARLAQRYPGLRVAVPSVAHVADSIAAAAAHWPCEPLVLRGAVEKYDCFAAANAALAASGTVSLELALARLPQVIAYKVNPATAWVARRLLRVRHVNLVNLILDRAVVPELLQERCEPEGLATEIARLLDDEAARAAQIAQAAEAARLLGQGGPSPSARAADIVLDVIARHQRTKP